MEMHHIYDRLEEAELEIRTWDDIEDLSDKEFSELTVYLFDLVNGDIHKGVITNADEFYHQFVGYTEWAFEEKAYLRKSY